MRPRRLRVGQVRRDEYESPSPALPRAEIGDEAKTLTLAPPPNRENRVVLVQVGDIVLPPHPLDAVDMRLRFRTPVTAITQ